MTYSVPRQNVKLMLSKLLLLLVGGNTERPYPNVSMALIKFRTSGGNELLGGTVSSRPSHP